MVIKTRNFNKVLILANQAGKGGTERSFINLINALKQSRLPFNMTLVVLEGEIETHYEYECKTILLTNKIPADPAGFFFFLIFSVYKIRQIKAEERPDITISFFNAANIVNVLSRSRERVFLNIHNFLSQKIKEYGMLGSIAKYMLKYFYYFADKIITPSEGMKKDMVEKFGLDGKKIHIIPNMIDILSIQNAAGKDIQDAYQALFSFPVIVTTGRLERQKSQKNLIKSFLLVKDAEPSAKLLILGDGTLRPHLLKLSYELGFRVYSIWDGNQEDLSSCDICFLGFQTNPFPFLAQSRVFAFPSIYESFGYAIAEAMICGVPVVSADCRSGPREILAPDTDPYYETKNIEYADYGILMPVFSDDSFDDFSTEITKKERLWSHAIIELLKDEKLQSYYKEKALKRGLEFESGHIVESWLRLIEQT